MAIIIGIFFVLWPLLSAPLVLIGYFYNPKYRTFYSILFGIIIGLFAYYLNPPETYDLYRHHLLVDDAATYSLSGFMNAVAGTSEPIQALVTYFVSMTHNQDLLQFLVVSTGYSILLYLIGDFAKRHGIKKSSLFLVLLFTLTSFTCINFFSGLWNYIAMLVFALIFYWETFRGLPKWIAFPLYLITPIVHSSMFFPIILLAIFKMFGEKINFRTIAVMLGVFVAPSILLPLINSLVDIPIFAQLEPMYNAYFLNGARFYNLYGGNVMIMELLKISLYVIIALLLRTAIPSYIKNRDFVILLALSTLLLVVNGVVFLRFVLLVQFIGAPLLMLYFDGKQGRIWLMLTVYVFILSIVFIVYQYLTLKNLNFSPLSLNHFFFNAAQLFIK